MFDYRINIDKNVLKLLGAQLYGDTASIISELVQNAYDADAQNVWITLNTGNEPTIIVQDDGIGMSADEINDRFLNIGQDRREKYPLSPGGRKVLGRKGIGKLAVFSLAKIIDVCSHRSIDSFAACRMDFDKITREHSEPEDIAATSMPTDPAYLSSAGTGTTIILRSIQKDVSRSLNYIINRLTRTFDVNSDEFKIFVRKNNDSFSELSRKDLKFTEHMDAIITFGSEFETKIDEIYSNPINKRYKWCKRYEELAEDKFQVMPYEIEVLDRNGQPVKRNFSFSGWIGTMHKRPSFKAFIDKTYANEQKSRFEVSLTDNRITVFSRGKVGEFDILPKVQTNRIADAYVIGELFVDIFEDDDLADMAISNRRGYDESDQRYAQLIRIVTDVVSYITRRKEDINKKIKDDENQQGALKVRDSFLSNAPRTRQALQAKLSPEEQSHFQDELMQFGRALNLSNSTKKIFISHKTECAEYGKFLIRCFELCGMDVKNTIIFSSMKEYGVPHDQDIYDYLRNCFRDDLYVIFLFSRSFYNSNMCIAETGAAWATNKKYSNVVIDMGFGGIDRPINNAQIGLSLGDMNSDTVIMDIRDLVKNAFSNIGEQLTLDDGIIEQNIKTAIAEFKDKLLPPTYLPSRKYLAYPICHKCGSNMDLRYNASNELVYTCIARKCTETYEAEISN